MKRLYYWFIKKFAKPQYCQCDHLRCMHEKGKRHCHELIENERETRTCRCQKFIGRRDGGRGKEMFPTPSPQDLERMIR